MLIVFIYATLGGMKGITWTQVAQYWVLITAFLVPAIAISIKLTGQPHGHIHAELRRQCGGPAVGQATVAQLQARIDLLRRQLHSA